MNKPTFNEFLASDDTLRVYEGSNLLFASKKERLLPLLEYIDGMAARHHDVVVLDKIMGNAAALLAVKASCREVYSPLGSEVAVTTLDRYGVRHHLNQVVSCIKQDNSEEMCPMEKLSLGKTPDEFYAALKLKAGR